MLANFVRLALLTSPLIACAVALGVSLGAHAGDSVYKWVDSEGTVNYGNAPASQGKAIKLEWRTSRLSIYSALPPPADPAPLSAPAPVPVKRERAPPALAPMIPGHRDTEALGVQREHRDRQLADWRMRCVVERGHDCDDDRALTSRYGRSLGWLLPGPAPK